MNTTHACIVSQLEDGKYSSSLIVCEVKQVFDLVSSLRRGFHEPDACYGLGVVVHALANTQNLLKLGYSERDCNLS